MRTGWIYAALGFGSGAAIGWAVTADIYEKRLRDEKLDSLEKDLYLEKENNPIVEVEFVDPNQTELIMDQRHLPDPYLNPDPEETPNSIDSVEAVESLESVRPSRVEELISQYEANPEAQEEFARQATISQEPENSQPFVIPRNDFAYDDEGQHYEKVTVTYYPDDRVVLDDEDEPINDVLRTIGWRNLARFGDESGDANVVFIRNRRMETDFEVVKEEDSPLPLHVKYGMQREEFNVSKAAGLVKLRPEDED